MDRASKELDRGLRNDSLLIRLGDKLKKNRYEKIALAALLIGLTITIIIIKVQLSYQELINKTNSIHLYNIGRNVEKINRRNHVIGMVTKVALKYHPKINEIELAKVAALLYDVGELRYEIPVEEWIVLITRESEWNRKARSYTDAKGLMQLMPITAAFIADKLGVKFLGDRTLYSYTDNVRIGMYYFYLLKKGFKYPEYYFSAYFWGERTIGQYYWYDKNEEIRKELKGKHRTYYFDHMQSTKRDVEKIIGRKIILGL